MQRLIRLFATFLIGATVWTLAACGATVPASMPAPTAGSSAQTLPLRNELISSIELAGKPGIFETAWDATPDLDGMSIYFTATGGQGAGVFKVAAAGGETTAVAVGAPFVAPRGLAMSGDGKQVFVADEQAGKLFAVPVAGGAVAALSATDGSAPQNLAVVGEGGGDVIYFSGKDPADGQPAVLKLSRPQEGTLSVVAKGAPLVQPGGIAVTKGGVLYVADRAAGGNGLGAVFRVQNGTVEKIADHFRAGTPVVGATLTMDDSLLLVSALAQDRDSAQVLVIDLASAQQGLITKVIEANTGAGGIHRAARQNIFAWADSTSGKQRSGGVYAIRP